MFLEALRYLLAGGVGLWSKSPLPALRVRPLALPLRLSRRTEEEPRSPRPQPTSTLIHELVCLLFAKQKTGFVLTQFSRLKIFGSRVREGGRPDW